MNASSSSFRPSDSVYNTLLEGLQILDRDWRYVFVNAAAERHNRRPAGELLGRRYADCWPGVETTEAYRQIRGVLETGESVHWENLFVFPDGTVGWFDLRIQRIPEGVVILSVDVTDRRRAEQALARSLRLYQTLSQVNQAIVRLRDSRHLYRKICDIVVEHGGFDVAWLGLVGAQGEVVPQARAGDDVSNPVRQDVVSQALETDEVVVAADLVSSLDFPYRAVAAVPFRVGRGDRGVLIILSKEMGLLGAPEDKNLLEELGGDLTFALTNLEQERQARLWADAFEHCAHGIVIGDPATNTIVTCNPAFANAQRSSRDRLVGSPFLETYSAEARHAVEARLHEADETGRVQFEVTKRRQDGSTYRVQLDIVSVRDEAGTLLYRVTTVQDITARQQLQAQLLQSQKWESLGALSSGVAHDFNNLLAVILGNAQLLRDFPEAGPAFWKRVEAILTAGKRGTDLVKQLLSLARQGDDHIEAVDVSHIAAEVADLLAETLPRTIEVRRALPELPAIEADPTQIHQLILNLGVNARDAMGQGGVLTLTTSMRERAGVPFVALAVSDTGAGMDEATKARIFEPFFTTKPEGKGTGLGLATVFAIVQRHQGLVEVQSAVGEGSVFCCWFPVAQSPAPKHQEPFDSWPMGSGTILVVEDEPSLQQWIEALLTRQGYQVVVASDGFAASEVFLGRSSWSAVVSDLGLPGQSGDALFRSLHARAPSTPWILASGYFEPGLRERLASEGVAGFLQKPYQPDKVLALLQSVVKP